MIPSAPHPVAIRRSPAIGRRLAAACVFLLLAAAPLLHADPLEATDLDGLRPHVGEAVEIHGTPTGSGVSKSGTVAYLNFAGAHKAVALVFFIKSGVSGKVGSEDDVKAFVGKPITVKGKLADYKGDLQIVIDGLDQITAAP